MELPVRDGDGYLQDRDLWSEDIAKAMADVDGVTIDEQVESDPEGARIL